MAKKTQNIKYKDINSLISAEYNPRQLKKEQYQNIKESLQRFGFVDPVIINKNKDRKNIIIGGHQRVKVAKDLKYTEVPCVELDLTLDKEKELNIRLNKNVGEWDYDILANLFDFNDLMDWGFTEDDLAGFSPEEVEVEGLTDDDDIPEDVESVCKLGDIWKLGNHRLLCGDSTKKENIELLLDGNKADMVFTDPPYGMNLDTDYSGLSWGDRKGKKYEKVIGDNEDFKPELITTLFKHFDYCKEFFLWGADYYYKHIKDFDQGHYIVWDKTLESNGDAGSNSEFELLWTKQKHKRQVLHFNWFRYFGLSKQDVKKRIHPTQKPLQVVLPFVENYSKKNEIIIDLYLGSGSTLIACEKTNRKCYGMELDEHYCDVIINRWEQFTGKKAELINGTS